MTRAIEVTREQVVAYRRRANGLDERLPPGPESLRSATWAGLQDSMPRAAILSLHARIEGIGPSILDDPALAQVWGPRFQAYVVAEQDAAYFTLGRYPDDARGRRVAEETAARLQAFLDGRRMGYGTAGDAMGVTPNSLRYATTTGRVRIRWEGARQPEIWTLPRPAIEPLQARRELARRYLRVFGPTTPAAFANWAGIGTAQGRGAFESLGDALLAVRAPIGDAWILEEDEAALRAPARPAAPARLLPSGDAFFLLHGADRELLLPDPLQRAELWTSRVWPGALLVAGGIAGTWRRDHADVTARTWWRLSPAQQAAVEAEAASLPLPDLRREIRVRWED